MKNEPCLSREQLENMYWKSNLSVNKIGEKIGCSSTKVHYWLVRYGIKRREEYKKGLCLNKKILEEMYLRKKLSLEDIARKFGCNNTNILYWLKKFDIKRRPAYRKKIDISRETLERLYWKENLTTTEIANRFGIRHGRTVHKKIMRYNIKRKTLSQILTKKRKSLFSGDLREKSYLLGLRTGDFYARQRHKSVRVQTTTTHLAQIDLLKKAFEKYGEHRIYLSRNKAREDEWFIYTDLHPSFEFLLYKPHEIPKWILDNDEYFYNFLSAYMDCEGYWRVVRSHENSVRFIFGIQTGDKRVLEQIKERLESCGYVPRLYLGERKGKKKLNFRASNVDIFSLIMYRKNEVISLIKILLPLSMHSEKIRKMEFIIRNKHKNWEQIVYGWNRLREEIKTELLKNQNS